MPGSYGPLARTGQLRFFKPSGTVRPILRFPKGTDFSRRKGIPMKAMIVSFALVAASVVSASAQTPNPNSSSNITGSEQFCLKAIPDGNANCIYQSMGVCETAKRAVNSSGECVSRPERSGTTGSGGSSMPPGTPPAGGNPPAGSPPR